MCAYASAPSHICPVLQCDEIPAAPGNQPYCPADSDVDDCKESANNNSCDFAKDGQCDEPVRGGSGYCETGTDSYDCDKECERYREEEGLEKDCEEIRGLQGGECGFGCMLLSIILLMLCCSYPCMVFGVAWFTCIRQKKQAGKQPTPNAWAICMSVMVFVVYFLGLFAPGGLGLIGFCFGPCCMIAPFLMDECYCDCPGGPQAGTRRVPWRVGQVAPCANNPVYGGSQPITVMAVPVGLPSPQGPLVMAQPMPVQAATAVPAQQQPAPQSLVPQQMNRGVPQAVVVASVVQDDI